MCLDRVLSLDSLQHHGFSIVGFHCISGLQTTTTFPTCSARIPSLSCVNMLVDCQGFRLNETLPHSFQQYNFSLVQIRWCLYRSADQKKILHGFSPMIWACTQRGIHSNMTADRGTVCTHPPSHSTQLGRVKKHLPPSLWCSGLGLLPHFIPLSLLANMLVFQNI